MDVQKFVESSESVKAFKAKLPREDVVRIVFAQKLFICLFYPLLYADGCITPFVGQYRETTRFFVLAVVLVILGAIRTYIVVQLCTALKKRREVILFASLMQFVPCLWFVFQWHFSIESTVRLRQCGIRVGLFGANSSDVANYDPPMNVASGGT